jgi:hypothetical protein
MAGGPPYQPFYMPYGMSEEEYSQEVAIAQQKHADWIESLSHLPSIPTLPEHEAFWKELAYQVVEEGEFFLADITTINTFIAHVVDKLDTGNNNKVAVPVYIPKQQQKEEMKTSIPINIGSLHIPYSLEKFKELGVLNIDVEGEEFVYIRKDKVNEMLVEWDKTVSEKYTPKEVKEDLWEEVFARYKKWSHGTFGIDTHGFKKMRKEIEEVEAEPSDLKEWSDVLMCFMYAFSCQFPDKSISELLPVLIEKLSYNEKCKWIQQPDGTWNRDKTQLPNHN